MQNTPAYPIGSVDHALRLALLLGDRGPMRVADVADELEVARSTAHRLLAMLVFHGFAVQDADRRYRAGPALAQAGSALPGAARLREAGEPHAHALTQRTGETVNLLILVGTEVEFVASVEGPQLLRVGGRIGRRLPAHLASGGRAMLAALSQDEVRHRYVGSPGGDVEALLADLAETGRRGFAINDQRTERGVTAIGAAIDVPAPPTAAVAIAVPSVRIERHVLDQHVRAVIGTAQAIAADLDAGPS